MPSRSRPFDSATALANHSPLRACGAGGARSAMDETSGLTLSFRRLTHNLRASYDSKLLIALCPPISPGRNQAKTPDQTSFWSGVFLSFVSRLTSRVIMSPFFSGAFLRRIGSASAWALRHSRRICLSQVTDAVVSAACGGSTPLGPPKAVPLPRSSLV